MDPNTFISILHNGSCESSNYSRIFWPEQSDSQFALFPADLDITPYSWEYCEASGTIEYLSKCNKSKRFIERILTIQKLNNSNEFRIVGATHNGYDLPDDWLSRSLDSALSDDSFHDMLSCDSSSPTSTELTESPDLKRRRNDSITSNYSLESLVLNLSDVVKVRDAFFNCDCLDPCRLTLMCPDEEICATVENSSEFCPILVSIEGNIGAGKSTLLTALRKTHPEWIFIDEPVDFWTSLKNEKGQSLLELYYGDKRRWSYTFQNCAVLSRYQNMEKTITAARSHSKGKTVFVTERCLDTDHFVFAKMLHDDHKMDRLEYDLYQKWFKLLKKSATPLSAIINVDTEPTVCVQRIRGRAREGEDGIPLAFLESLHAYQCAWMSDTHVPSLRVASDQVEAVGAFVSSLLRAC